MSSDLQSASSIQDQIRLCREWLVREAGPGVPVGVYIESALSGASLLRPGRPARLADLRTMCFDMVPAEALDRLSHGQGDVAGVYERLGSLAVPIETRTFFAVAIIAHLPARPHPRSGAMHIPPIVSTLAALTSRTKP